MVKFPPAQQPSILNRTSYAENPSHVVSNRSFIFSSAPELRVDSNQSNDISKRNIANQKAPGYNCDARHFVTLLRVGAEILKILGRRPKKLETPGIARGRWTSYDFGVGL